MYFSYYFLFPTPSFPFWFNDVFFVSPAAPSLLSWFSLALSYVSVQQSPRLPFLWSEPESTIPSQASVDTDLSAPSIMSRIPVS